MISLSSAKSLVSCFVGSKALVVAKYSPEILVVVGVVGVIGATVLACKATLKVDEVLEEARENFDKIHEVAQLETDEAVYSEEDYRRDLVIVHVQRAAKLVKLYAPAIIIGVISVGCIIGSYKILSGRNMALISAYKLLDEAFKNYRGNVINEYGPEKDRELRYKVFTPHEEVIIGKDGKEVETRKGMKQMNPAFGSPYARFFDENSHRWSKSGYDYNLFFLQCQQNYLNDVLRSRGYVFLNEAYDSLGLPWSKAGQVVGWVNNGNGDDYIDFNLFDARNEPGQDLVNGFTRAFLVDFNVDGIIWDLI